MQSDKILPKSALIALMMALATSICVLDIYIPALPVMKRDLITTESILQWSLTIGFIGVIIAAPFWGFMGEKIGRRKSTLYGAILFCFSLIGCSLAKTGEVFLFFRLLGSLNSPAINVSVSAIITDFYKGKKAARYFSYIGTMNTTFLLLAPIMGGFLTTNFSWRWGFSIIGILTLIAVGILYFTLPESGDKSGNFEEDGLNKFMPIIKKYKTILRNLQFCIYTTMPWLIIGGSVGYQSKASYIFVERLGMESSTFGFYMGAPLAVNTLFNMLFGLLMRSSISLTQCLKIGVLICLCGVGAFFIAATFVPDSAFWMTFAMCIYSISIPMISNPSSILAVEMYPKMKSLVSGLMTSVRVCTIGLGMGFISLFYTGSMLSIACGLLLILLYQIASLMILTRYPEPSHHDEHNTH